MAQVETSLSLGEFVTLMAFNPWHFFQYADSEGLLVNQSCDPVLRSHAWQSHGGSGRDEVVRAIATAEEKFHQIATYWPGLRFREETINWPVLQDPRIMRSNSMGADWRWLSVAVPDTQVQCLGVETLVPIQLNAAVVYQDWDQDGYRETAEIGPLTIPVGLTIDLSAIVTLVTANDLPINVPPSTQYQVRPLQARVISGSLYLRGDSYLFAPPKKYEGVSPNNLDPSDASNFLSVVNVYQSTCDGTSTDVTSSQGTIIWETRPYHSWWCCCDVCTDPQSGAIADPASTAQAVARGGIRDGRLGLVHIAEAIYNTQTGIWAADSFVCDQPDRAIVRYQAGIPRDPLTGGLRSDMADIISILAAAELQTPICGCAESNRRLAYWQQDLAKIGSEKELYTISQRNLDNPLGTRRGQVEAWNRLQRLSITTGVRV